MFRKTKVCTGLMLAFSSTAALYGTAAIAQTAI